MKINNTPTNKYNVIIDEAFRIPKSLDSFKYMISNSRLLGVNFIMAAQYYSHLDNIIDSSNLNFMIFGGINKDDFVKLQKSFANLKFEDLINIPKYQALCLLKDDSSYSSFTIR